MIPVDPANIWFMHNENYIKSHGLLEVTSQLIYEPSSTNFHPAGFFSELIFGQIGSPSRINTLGYLSCHTKTIAPHVWKNTIDLKPVYDTIMQGKTYAVWNDELHRFDPCAKDTEEADTGYAFFITHFNDIVFEPTTSHTRNNKITAIEKAKETDCAIVNTMIVAPAGLRDVREENGRVKIEDINKLYNSILVLSQELKTSVTNPILMKFYDGIKYNLQLKIYQIFDYWKEFLDGKGGFLQRRYARRAIAYGTRNVVTSANMTGLTTDDPQFLKHEETLAPVYQSAKAFQPLVVHYIKSLFYDPIFAFGSMQVPAINTDTKKVQYIEVSNSEITKALSANSGEELINAFQNTQIRLNPVSVKNKDSIEYWLYLVYDTGNEIYLLRNIDNFKDFMRKNKLVEKDEEIDESKFRPLTYLEMMYIATFYATKDKYATLTRYPVVGLGSIYPTKVKVSTTVPSRKIYFSSQYETNYQVEMPCYPILGNNYQDSIVFHPSQAAGLGA